MFVDWVKVERDGFVCGCIGRDLNLKFLRSLPSEWNTLVVVWRNKPDLDTMSFDDLYNNFNIVEQEVKRTTNSSSSSLNIAFVSSPSSTNDVNTSYGVSIANTQASPVSTQVSTASTQVSTANLSDVTVYAFLASQPNGSQIMHHDLIQIHEDDLQEIDLKWHLTLLSMRTRRFLQKSGRKITINRSDTAGYDKSKVECFNCHKLGHFTRKCRQPRIQDSRNRNQDSSRRTVNVEETTSNAMVAIDGANFDWSYIADDESLDKLIVSQIPDNSKKGVGFVSYNAVPPPPTRLFSPPKLDLSNSSLEEFQQPEFEDYGPKTSKSVREDIPNEVKESPDALLVKELVLDDKLEKKNANCNYHQRERVVSRNNYTRVNYNNSTRKTHSNAHRNMAPRAVLMETGLRPLNTAMPVNTAHPKTTVYSARPMLRFSKSAQSTIKRPYQQRTTLTNKSFSQKVNTAKRKFYTARPRAVNTVRPNSTVVNDVRVNQINAVKASACWVLRPTKLNSASITLKKHNYGHPQKEDKDYVDSGCLRHMTGNMSYLSDFKEFDRGYVTFGGGAKGEKITGKGTLKTGKLDFEDMYFVKEFLFNLLSVLQLCDKKNSVLFTDTKCFVLSPDFKLVDESQVLLKVPRKNNMYSVDMKNIVPKESLTCLVAKATLDESMLWHRRICYNRVLVVKPRNKTPYELFRGRTPALSFMRLFGCHVTILNTLDHLRKFDGKSDDGLFVGYSLNSKAFRVYNVRTRKVEENMHIKFLEDKPIIAGDGPKWLFDIDALIKSMNYVPLVAGTNSNDFVATEESIGASHASKNANNDEPQPFSNAEKKDDDGVTKEITTALLEATHADLFGDETKVDMSNITTTYLVPSTPNKRIHKDHLLNHVIGDVQSGVQTRRMTKTTNEQGFISAVYKGKTHEDLHTYVFACFLSQEEPKKGYTQEEGIDYDEVVAPIARIKAIMLFLAYASFKDFVVYQMDVKSAFLYGKIKEEVYVCQPLGSTPMETSKPLLKDENAKDVDVRLYRSMIGSLMYLTSPRPDIMFVDSPINLEAYTDSDYAGASLDRKSTT
nr:ribonuclease H-like domain-containing protein [Tanacetum cinerariifolium]